MNLKDLYDAIDWSGADTAYAKWAIKNNPEELDIAEFQFYLRSVWLLYSLPKQMLPEEEQEEWTEQRRDDARYFLAMAGVWNQVVDWLEANDFLKEETDVGADEGSSGASQGDGRSGNGGGAFDSGHRPGGIGHRGGRIGRPRRNGKRREGSPKP